MVFGLAALIAASCGGREKPVEAARAVRFGFWGDTPYSGDEARAVVNLVEQTNDAGLDLALFVGDIFGGTCENSGYTEAADLFNSLRGPVVYVPGDNEWTDCHPTRKDPLERLAHIRRMMFATDRSFGDSHRFVHDQPLVDAAGQKVANVTRIETFGSPDVGWVEVMLDPSGATPLLVEPRLVKGAPR